MKSLIWFLILMIVPLFAYAIPGDCVAVIYHDTDKSPTDDLSFINVRWNEVDKLKSALPIVMIVIKFGVFGPFTTLRFSGEDYYRIDFVGASSFDIRTKLLIGATTTDDANNMIVTHQIAENPARLHELRDDGEQILGKELPAKFVATLFSGAIIQFYVTEEGDLVELQDRAKAIDVGICATG